MRSSKDIPLPSYLLSDNGDVLSLSLSVGVCMCACGCVCVCVCVCALKRMHRKVHGCSLQ